MALSGAAAALGEAIRRQREQSAISMRQFAGMAGISNPYLSQIERGLRAPSEQVIDAIARSLETSVDTLYEQAGLHRDEPPAEARDAIERDQQLTNRQRRALIEIYDAFLTANTRTSSGERKRSVR